VQGRGPRCRSGSCDYGGGASLCYSCTIPARAGSSAERPAAGRPRHCHWSAAARGLPAATGREVRGPRREEPRPLPGCWAAVRGEPRVHARQPRAHLVGVRPEAEPPRGCRSPVPRRGNGSRRGCPARHRQVERRPAPPEGAGGRATGSDDASRPMAARTRVGRSTSAFGRGVPPMRPPLLIA
jgi:hypothetical protein